MENKLAEILNVIIIENKIMIINLWSFVHIGAGVLLGLLKFIKPVWGVVLILLYEVIEFILARTTSLFRVEPMVDIIWDLVLTIGFYLLAYKFLG